MGRDVSSQRREVILAISDAATSHRAKVSTITFQALIDSGILQIGDGHRAKHSELGGSGLPFLRSAHVRDSHVDFDGIEHFEASLTTRLANKTSRTGDTIVTTKGNSTGRTAFVESWMPTFVYSPHLSFWRSLDVGLLVPRFLRYWSRGEEFREQLDGMKASTDMAPYLSLEDQRSLRITLPDASCQRAIASVLGALDDKIEVNRKISHTLESIAMALFRSWFVDFDPVVAKSEGRAPFGMSADVAALFPDRFMESELGRIPRDWKAGTLAEVATNTRAAWKPHEARDSEPYVGLEHIPRRSLSLSSWSFSENASSGKTRFRRGAVLFGKLRPYFHKVAIAPCDGICSTDILAIEPKAAEFSAFVTASLFSDDVIAHADACSEGTKMPRVKWRDLGAFQLPIPDSRVAAAFSSLIAPSLWSIPSRVHESCTLAALRDALLEPLLSGTLRIRDAERIVSDAV